MAKARFSTVKAAVIIIGLMVFCAQAALVTYPSPAGFPTNSTFSVQVREPGGAWQDLSVYSVTLLMEKVKSSFVTFSFSGTIEMKVTLNTGTLTAYEIRPASFGITPTKNGNTLTFAVTQNDTFPRKFVVRVNNDWAALCLHVLGNPLEINPPSPSQVTYYFGPGMYDANQSAVLRNLKSNDKVYIAGGAVVVGNVKASRVNNVWIGGRGIIIVGTGNGIEVDNALNFTVDGIVLIKTDNGWCTRLTACDHFTLSNFSLFGSGLGTDGIHFDACQNCLATGCFLRTCDDMMLVNGLEDANQYWPNGFIPPGTTMRNSTNNRFMNIVAWGDKAQIMVVGFAGIKKEYNVIKDILYQNIDVLTHYDAGADFQGVIKVWCTENQSVSNITFNDIRIMPFKDPTHAKVFMIQTAVNYAYNWPGSAVRNVVVRNLSYTGTGENQSSISGDSTNRTVDNVTFINYTRNGTLVTAAANGNVKIGDNAFHIRFLGPQTSIADRPASP